MRRHGGVAAQDTHASGVCDIVHKVKVPYDILHYLE